MDDLKFFNFTFPGPVDVQISSSDETIIHSEVLNIIKKNHLIEKRLEKYRSLGIKTAIYLSPHDIPFYNPARFFNYSVKDLKIGNLVIYYSSNDAVSEHGLARSYYIQVSKYRVLYKHGCEKPCTVFVEIPVKDVAKLIRKLKLTKLNTL
jgi:hypothetical protein